ncbi:MAG: hypothetical protein ACD_30C00111G0007 [uncultured bacterium]|uniref:Mannosyltransferase n=3 Tax=Candidatus Daviesiibacteriota TaxID=1752718 RepID=A0A0G0EML6_9BACT|nr:MAG: hypothetical protein ACD_30C00111G0007 [uncultured bacterium]KKQ08333.1 MAG: hypothetical protein US19_C0027G0010 [Candidatus Daviesbacteria bacterium GW2011_GWB1_36_5]KKQ15189.1 MAG: hypothetical protein US28_C0021G0020 [Candidatus Daviesbacteria bacterium GW2011_GWA1_36_8]OGE36236.1 MAG: hypothetical protein A3E66_05530 [Candidatus Daviesbacteria bacterium RIFCSPHIGHO2_12_FULL_37_16]
MQSARNILIFGLLISVLIRGFFISQSLHIADIYLLYNMGVSLFNGFNPYLKLDFYSYPPLAILIQTFSVFASPFVDQPFVVVSKFFPNFFDTLTGILIYKFLANSGTKPKNAAGWAVFYLLNPLSIIISSIHGQLEGIFLFFVVFSIYFLKKNYLLAGLIYGISIAIKPSPLILFPLFLFAEKINFKQKIYFCFLSVAPTLISVLPFLEDNSQKVISSILGYQGVFDMSYGAVLKGVWFSANENFDLPLIKDFASASRLLFLSAYITILLLFLGSKNFIKRCLAVILSYYIFTFGVSVQHLYWVLPLAILAKDRLVILYTFFASLAVLGFYLYLGPDILLGKLGSIEPLSPKYFPVYVLGNLVFWGFCVFWVVKIIKPQLEELKKFSLIRRKLTYFSLGIFLITFIIGIKVISEFFQLL